MLLGALFTNLLLTTAAIAAPESRIEVRRERRAAALVEKAANRSSLPLQISTETVAASNASNTLYTVNWAGAVWDTYPAGTFTQVTGTFTVPTPSAPDGSASAWVGVDGDTCRTAILQTGIDFHVSNGVVSYDSWYEWFPEPSVSFSGITFSPGDEVRLTVAATSTLSGTATIENLTNGQTVSTSITGQAPLCQENAEWIVEDYSQGGQLVPLCNFGTVTFTNATATLASGGTIDPNGATEINIKQNGQVLTSISEAPGSVTIQYV